MPHAARIALLQEAIQARGLAGALLFYSRDILYYTGTAQPSYLVVRPDDYMLFIRRGFAFAQEDCDLPPDRLTVENHLAVIARRMFPDQRQQGPIGTELDLLTVAHYRHFQKALDPHPLVDISDAILDQRTIKDSGEIANFRKACTAVHAGHLRILERLRPGMSELALSAEIEYAQRLAGHEGAFFMRQPDFVMSRGPLASGPNLRRTSGTIYTITGTGLSSAVPAGPSRRILQSRDLVVVDIPTCVEGYHADQSRTYAVGHAPPGAKALFARLKEIADHLIDRLAPGMSTGEAFALAEQRAAALGLADAFLAFESQPSAHFIGHGVGLEVNEPPLLARNGKAILAPHMVLAIEMHLMEPDGLTLKLEDTVHLTDNGVEILTVSPRELTVVD
ncbi:MAG: aminopeptidase P family protein [Desulfatitalea sp.]|nr:aminopeptidase P family protein [Desulfatitalea sp.]